MWIYIGNGAVLRYCYFFGKLSYLRLWSASGVAAQCGPFLKVVVSGPHTQLNLHFMGPLRAPFCEGSLILCPKVHNVRNVTMICYNRGTGLSWG